MSHTQGIVKLLTFLMKIRVSEGGTVWLIHIADKEFSQFISEVFSYNGLEHCIKYGLWGVYVKADHCHQCMNLSMLSLQWRHNGHDGITIHQRLDCLLNCLPRHRSKKTSKLHVTGHCAGNSPEPVNSSHKRPVTRKMYPFDDVIMIVPILNQEANCSSPEC